jgi:hypothetical protein
LSAFLSVCAHRPHHQLRNAHTRHSTQDTGGRLRRTFRFGEASEDSSPLHLTWCPSAEQEASAARWVWWAGNAHPRTLEEPLGCSQTNFVHICQKSSSREIPQPSWERAPPPLTLPCPQGAGCESSTPGTVHIRCSAANSPLHPPDFGLDRPNFAWVRKETLGGHAAKTPESAQGPTLGSGVNFG